MTGLMALLAAACQDLTSDTEVGLLLSGGIDSISVGMGLEAAGKSIHAYTIELEGYPSGDLHGAQLVAHYMGWPLEIISVPTEGIADDFIRLAAQHSCKRKVQFECTFPLMYAFPVIEEDSIFTGFNADDHYGNTREAIFDHDRLVKSGRTEDERHAWFDSHRKSAFGKVRDLESGDTWGFAQRLARESGKHLCDPYLDDRIEAFFSSFTHEELARPNKPIVRQALGDRITALQEAIKSGLRLQKSTGVSDLFETLLSDPRINRFDKRYPTVASLCQRWGKEVAAEPTQFKTELSDLPHASTASRKGSRLEEYTNRSMSDAQKTSDQRRFSVASMFAGGGGSSLGYRLAGGKVLFVNEFVAEAATTYRANFPDVIVAEDDIRDLLNDQPLLQGLLAKAGLKIGELDILDGSPPCSEFSVSGKGISDQSVPKRYSDREQRGIATLPFDYVDMSHALKPKVVIMENVPSLAARAASVLERIKEKLRFSRGSRAYFVTHAVLNAAEFGVPQKRRRLFIMGVRADIAERLGVRADEDVLKFFPRSNHVPVTIRNALKDVDQTENQVWPWKSTPMTTDLGRLVRLLPKNPPRLVRLSEVAPDINGNFTLTRCSWDHPVPTLTVVGQSPSGLAGAIHPSEDRKFTLAELKRLTGVPDDFILTGTLAQAAERLCRMVPPPLTKAIAESVLDKILLPAQETSHDQ